MKPLLAFLIAALLAAPAARADGPPTLPDVEDEVMCTICGTLLEMSESPQADQERALIRRLIAEGRSKDEIKDALVAQYGSRVLAAPKAEGFDLTAWVVPIAGFVAVAIALLVFALGRRRRQTAPAGPGVSSEDDQRLERDMSRYDL